jgi:hypothetical protein
MKRVSLSSRVFPFTFPLLLFILFSVLVGCLLGTFLHRGEAGAGHLFLLRSLLVHLWRVEHLWLLQSLPSVPPSSYGHCGY